MKMLHILKSEPDESVEEILEAFSEEEVDWAALVDDIFSHDKVICWW
jgi:hypothetical protein